MNLCISTQYSFISYRTLITTGIFHHKTITTKLTIMTSRTNMNRNKNTKILCTYLGMQVKAKLLPNPPHASATRTTTKNKLNPIRSQYQTRNKHLLRFSDTNVTCSSLGTTVGHVTTHSLTDARSASRLTVPSAGHR